jgi:hypothetical protein
MKRTTIINNLKKAGWLLNKTVNRFEKSGLGVHIGEYQLEIKVVFVIGTGKRINLSSPITTIKELDKFLNHYLDIMNFRLA